MSEEKSGAAEKKQTKKAERVLLYENEGLVIYSAKDRKAVSIKQAKSIAEESGVTTEDKT